ncbi:MAG: hypothetical protein HC897_02135 [Thermoanaerobaculia bacterium]|nr:hypothetical protein [Thermoanaerobaculia bacterium]
MRGSVGVVSGGRVNRDGIGAVVSFSTEGGGWQMVPILGGSSYASQDSLRANLGLGKETRGTVEVLWPGGVRNRLRGLRSGEKIVFPEIPCDLGDELVDRAGYVACLERALGELVAAGVLDTAARDRFYKSAFACEEGSETFCLNHGRFRVEVDWRDFMGRSGAGQTVPFSSDDSGNFWFFKPDNWEVLVKVLDGCSANDRFWVFASAATNVEYTLRVTDTSTSVTKTYFKPLGEAAPAITDTQAFASCP